MVDESDNTEYIALDEYGRYVAVNMYTGEERVLEGALTSPLEKFSKDTHTMVETSAGDLVYVPNNIQKAMLEELQGKNRSIPYSGLIAEKILELVYLGHTLVQIAGMEGMPKYSTICKWRKEYPDFDEAYRMARKDRAEVYFNKMLAVVENAGEDKDEIALARLRSDIYKFAAKVSAPDDYAEKTTIDAKVAVGTFVIETGIRREGDAGFNVDHTREIVDAESATPTEIPPELALGPVGEEL